MSKKWHGPEASYGPRARSAATLPWRPIIVTVDNPTVDKPGKSLPVHQAAALRRLLDQVIAGSDVVLTADDAGGRAVLDAAAERLPGLRRRALRVHALSPGGISLSGMMTQVTDRPDPEDQDDQLLEQGFQALTVTDAACDGIVLLVSDAHLLQRAALRYVQFARRAGMGLRVVLAGRPELLDLLGADEFGFLQARFAAGSTIALPAPEPARAPEPRLPRAAEPPRPARPVEPLPFMEAPAPPPPTPLPVPRMPRTPVVEPRAAVSSRAPRRLGVPGWAAIGLGLAASLALGMWIGRNGMPFAPPSVSSTEPAAPPRAAPQPAADARNRSTAGDAPLAAAPMPVLPVPPAVPPPPTQSVPAPAPRDEATLPVPSSLDPAAPPSGPGTATQGRAAAPTPRLTDRRFRDQFRDQEPPQIALRPLPRTPWRVPGRLQGRLQPDIEDEAPSARMPDRGPDRAADRVPDTGPPNTFDPLYANPNRSGPFIGTYTTDANGVRVFRLNP